MELNVFQPWRVRIKEHCLSKQMQIIKINRRKHSELKELEELNLQISRYMTHTHMHFLSLSPISCVQHYSASWVCMQVRPQVYTHTPLSPVCSRVFPSWKPEWSVFYFCSTIYDSYTTSLREARKRQVCVRRARLKTDHGIFIIFVYV